MSVGDMFVLPFTATFIESSRSNYAIDLFIWHRYFGLSIPVEPFFGHRFLHPSAHRTVFGSSRPPCTLLSPPFPPLLQPLPPLPPPLDFCYSMLPGLTTRAGLHTWPVLTGSARFKGVKTSRISRLQQQKQKQQAAANARTSGEDVTSSVGGDGGGGGDTEVTLDGAKEEEEGGEKNVTAPAAAISAVEGENATASATATSTEEGAEIGKGGAGEGGDEGAAGTKGVGAEADSAGALAAGEEAFAELGVGSETPIEDAVKAGLRHHPSFAEVDLATSRK